MGGSPLYLYNVFVRCFGHCRRDGGHLGLPAWPAGPAWAPVLPAWASVLPFLGLSTAFPGLQDCSRALRRRPGGAPETPADIKLTCPPGLPDVPGPQYCLPGPQYCLRDCLKDFLRTATTAACVNVRLKYVQTGCQVPTVLLASSTYVAV